VQKYKKYATKTKEGNPRYQWWMSAKSILLHKQGRRDLLIFKKILFLCAIYFFTLRRFLSLIFSIMELIESAEELHLLSRQLRAAGKVIGFVPTMGALHKGHLSLINQAGESCDVVIVSIFVNPTQFNDPADLDRYPRNLQSDQSLLSKTKCELLFVPSVKEIYPQPDYRSFEFGQLDKVMEGKYRAGHFNGVAQVVSRLFDIVRPHKAFFGEKDFQQLAIIRAMRNQLNLDVEIVAVPIVREPDGLAMSSRNASLSEQHRKSAPLIAHTLLKSCNFASTNEVDATSQFVVDRINQDPNLAVEYFEIVDGLSLQPIVTWNESDYVVGCIAVFAGKIRLIDNVVYKS
jgi:pantoate--beta-alanine ligase